MVRISGETAKEDKNAALSPTAISSLRLTFLIASDYRRSSVFTNKFLINFLKS